MANGQTANAFVVESYDGTDKFVIDANGDITTANWNVTDYALPASYVIYKSGSTYYAKNGTTGASTTSDSSFSTVLQAILDTIGGTSGGAGIFLKAGDYTLDAAISETYLWKSRICGEGIKTRLTAAASLNYNSLLYFNSMRDTVIENLYIDGNRANQSSGNGRVIVSSNPQNCRLKNVIIQNPYGSGIQLDGTTSNGSFNNVVESCTVIGAGTNGIDLAGTLDKAYGNKVLGCWIEDFAQRAAGSGINVGGTYDVVVAHNTIKDSSNDTDTNACIHADLAQTSSTRDSGLVISDNICTECENHGILVQNSYHATVVGNHCFDNGGAGIYIENYGNSIVNNNDCFSNDGIGINLVAYTEFPHSSQVVGNRIYLNGGRGIHTDSNYVLIANNLCRSNIQTAESSAFREAGISTFGQYNLIIGNICYDDQETQTQEYGITDWNAAGNIGSNNVFMNNLVSGNKTAGMYVVGTNEAVRYNSGYVTEKSSTATITSGQSSVTVTHGLASTPTNVRVTGSTADTNALYVDTIGATTFKINAAGAVGGNRTVYWYAEV